MLSEASFGNASMILNASAQEKDTKDSSRLMTNENRLVKLKYKLYGQHKFKVNKTFHFEVNSHAA